MKILILTAFLASISVEAIENINITPTKGGISGEAWTTHYWDCCKPACGWSHNYLKQPVVACAKDGVQEVHDLNVGSSCQNGDAYACTNQHAQALNNTFSFGIASAFFGGGVNVKDMCCTCFMLNFHGLSTAKSMVVQVVNTGTDYDNNKVTFDLATPGGGVGMYNGCTKQWNAPPDGWGARYGGVGSREQCNELPPQLSDFCHWRFDFLESVPNPYASYTQVDCPSQFSSLTHCQRY